METIEFVFYVFFLLLYFRLGYAVGHFDGKNLQMKEAE